MKTLELTRTLYTVSDFVSWQKNKTLVLSPSFQRRSVWKAGAKSLFIDTLLRGLPIPIIFLREQKTDLKTLLSKREVIDGQQRIRTILSFVCPEFLEDYDDKADSFALRRVHNKELANKKFRDLPSELQERILDYQFSVHVLPSNVDDREVLQIFARMNSTGVKLNDQELRNANYFGEFKTLSYGLSTEYLRNWRDWRIFTENGIARMDEVEITSEFLIVMLKGIVAKTQSSINTVYEEFDEELTERDELERRFRHVMSVIEDRWGAILTDTDSALRKKTLFYALFASSYHLTYGIGSPLKAKEKPKPLSATEATAILKRVSDIEEQDAPSNVLDAAALRTTHASSRKALIAYLTKTKIK